MMYGGENITCGHQKAKCMNTIVEVFYWFNFSHVWFYCSLSGYILCPKCQRNQFLILRVFMGKNPYMTNMVKLGYGCKNGFIAQKQFNLAEECILRKCGQLLGLHFRIGDWLLW